MTIKKEMEGKANDFSNDYEEKKEKLKNKETKEQKEIEELKKCIRDKDKRITAIEDKFAFIRGIVLTVWYIVLIVGSYLLWLESWIFIASNGKWHIPEFINDFITFQGNTIPYTLEPISAVVLGIIMVILVLVLTLGWCIWFDMRDE